MMNQKVFYIVLFNVGCRYKVDFVSIKKFNTYFFSIQEIILELIKTHMDRDNLLDEPTKELGRNEEWASANQLVESTGNNSSKQIFHETAGWRNLETSMKCLQSIVQGCGYSFTERIDSDLLELIFVATRHTNRFVRETGYHTLSSIIEAASSDNRSVASAAFGTEEMETDQKEW